MELPKLKAMFSYLRRAFTTKESRELLSGFFPGEKAKINDLTDSEEKADLPIEDEGELSKMQQARRLYAKYPVKSRKEAIQLFRDNIPDLAHTTASTYYYQIAADRVRTASMLDQARAIFTASPVKTRKAIVEQFVAIGMPANVASTYYYKIKKELAEGTLYDGHNS